MQDKRTSERHRNLFHAIRTTAYLPTGAVLTGSIKDLSPGGAKVVGDTHGLSSGATVEMHLLFPLDGELHYRCNVAHIESDCWGAEFMELLPPPMARWSQASQFGRAELH